MRNRSTLAVAAVAFATACRHGAPDSVPAPVGATPDKPPAVAVPSDPRERHLANLRMLTFGGENAEAYFSPDGRQLVFQSTRDGHPCDQIYVMGIDGSNPRRVSNTGRTTCGYFLDGGKRVLYASTHHLSPECPPPPSRAKGYAWPLYSYDLFAANADGSDLRRLTDSPAYDAEATASPDERWIVFTSSRDGDLELYKMRTDGSQLTRLTNATGYDGGAFFSYDGNRIVWRAARPKDDLERAEQLALLKEGLVRPGRLEIMVMDADGANARRVTNNGAANFAPFFFPDGKRIVFVSNMENPKGHAFDLYAIRDDGANLERITYNDTFDGFPMFSPDGKKLVFASNRHGKVPGETNIFVADWVD